MTIDEMKIVLADQLLTATEYRMRCEKAEARVAELVAELEAQRRDDDSP